jgi:hypothetical protein
MLLERQTAMFESTGSVADKWVQACRFYESHLRSGYVCLLTQLSALGVWNLAIGDEVRKLRAQWRALLERVVDDDALEHSGPAWKPSSAFCGGWKPSVRSGRPPVLAQEHARDTRIVRVSSSRAAGWTMLRPIPRRWPMPSPMG